MASLRRAGASIMVARCRDGRSHRRGVLEDPRYLEFSRKLTEIGDTWRQFAAKCARICRSQKVELAPFAEAAALVRDCGVRERALFGEILEHELRKARPMAVLPAGQPQ